MKTSGWRILHVITPSRMAGAETLLSRLAPRQVARGDAVVIVCTRSRNRHSRALEVLRAASEKTPHETSVHNIPANAIFVYANAENATRESLSSEISSFENAAVENQNAADLPNAQALNSNSENLKSPAANSATSNLEDSNSADMNLADENRNAHNFANAQAVNAQAVNAHFVDTDFSNANSAHQKIAAGNAVQKGAEIWELPVGGKIDARAALVLWRAARRHRAEILHTHLSSASWWAGWLDALGLATSVGHVHGFTSALWHRRQSALVACSQAVKNHLVEQGISAAKIHVLLNPVSPDDVKVTRSREDIRAEIGAKNDTPVVGCFAHLSEKKGWRELMQAAPRVLEIVPDAQFWCAGDGPLRAELEATAREGGFANSVKFLGFRSDAANLMNAIDVFALPSHREPFGLVYVEAALLGKACIACDSGGAPEVVRHGESGLLVPPHDVAALAEAIITLLRDPKSSTQLGENGHVWALGNCGWDNFLDGLERVYATASSASRAKRR